LPLKDLKKYQILTFVLEGNWQRYEFTGPANDDMKLVVDEAGSYESWHYSELRSFLMMI
jgi:hypothetical protein